MTGLSRAQVTRLIGGSLRVGRVTAAHYQRTRFPSVYTSTDVTRQSSSYTGCATRRRTGRATPVTSPRGRRRSLSANGANRGRKVPPDTCASTPCIKGDQDGCKGVYQINAVDELTQWEIGAATPQISEFWLLPILEAILQQFPFVIHGFHSDYGLNAMSFLNS